MLINSCRDDATKALTYDVLLIASERCFVIFVIVQKTNDIASGRLVLLARRTLSLVVVAPRVRLS